MKTKEETEKQVAAAAHWVVMFADSRMSEFERHAWRRWILEGDNRQVYQGAVLAFCRVRNMTQGQWQELIDRQRSSTQIKASIAALILQDLNREG